MRLRKLFLRNLGTFRGEHTIDLDAIEGPLVALCGTNGAGKSTLLGMWPGGMYRKVPGYGKIGDFATAADSLLDAWVDDYRITHVMDGVRGKSEVSVRDADGNPLLEDKTTKVSSFKDWAARHLASPDVFLGGQFAAQGTKGMIGMTEGERKAVVLRALGHERLEALAKMARQRADARRNELSTLEARISDERRRASEGGPGLDDELERAKQSERDAIEAMNHARDAYTEAQKAASEAEKLAAEFKDRAEARLAIAGDLEKKRSELADLDRRIANNRAVLEDEAAIRQAAEDLRLLDTELLKAQRASFEASAGIRTNEQAAAGLERRIAQIDDFIALRETHLARVAEAEQAAAEVPTIRAELVALEAEVNAADANVERLVNLDRDGLGRRVRGLRYGLQRVIEDQERGHVTAEECLEDDDRAAEHAERLPTEIHEARQLAVQIQIKVATARERLAKAEREAATADQRQRLETELRKARDDRAEAQDERGKLAADLDALRAVFDEQDRMCGALHEKAEQLRPLAAKLAPLAEARTKLELYEPRRAEIAAELDRIQAELAATPELGPPPDAPDVAHFKSALEGSEKAFDEALRTTNALNTQLKRYEESRGALDELERKKAAELDELADWEKLSRDLGRDGIQALELDAAGPEISQTANELLHEAFGPRFTIRLDTLRASADGKKMIEDFGLTVIDTEGGREEDAKGYCGGEKVVLNEALSLALTVVACGRLGLDRPTIVRDESGAALAPENGPRYVAMLRRAGQIIGSSHVLFVSHNPELPGLADARIIIEDGAIRTEEGTA